MQPYVVVRRSMRASLLALPASLVLALGVGVAPNWAAAQDATPSSEGSRTIACEVSGTPTAMEGATPEPMESSPPASPVASPAVELIPTPAGTEATEGVVSTVRTIAECVNAGDHAVIAALLTENFITTVLGLASADEVPAALEGSERMQIRLLLTPETYDDGTASIIVVYEGFLNTTGAVVAERWFFVQEAGVYKLDRIEEAELPPGIS